MKRKKLDLATDTYMDLQSVIKAWVMGESYQDIQDRLQHISKNVDKLARENGEEVIDNRIKATGEVC